MGQWIGSSHILGSAFLPKVSRYIPVHVESLRRPTADDVFAGEQVDGNDGAHGGALTQVFSIGWAAPDRESSWNGMVFIECSCLAKRRRRMLARVVRTRS